jgi:hypothetical protein
LASATGKEQDDKVIDTLDAPSAQENKANTATAMSFAEYILSELRAASLRARLLSSEIDAIAVALNGGLVTADQALVLMNGVDLLRVIGERTDDE